ncbi:hypothetical protein CQA67_33245, partial [Klebsiella pneumoniae]
TCEIADRHLALAPGSDGGLFAGLLNALAEAGACIDPRRTATCEIADRHLALAPGSDGGLFAGLLNALAEAGAC